jgi:arylsulfatase A-like enzyme
MPVREVVRDLLEREPAWSVLRAHPAGSARVAILCPSEDFRVRGGDLPALVLPPPGEARFTVDAADAPAALELVVGFDGALVSDPALAGHGVRFTVAVDGATAFETVVPIEQVGEKPGAEWHAAPALPLSAGAEVTLATALIGPDAPNGAEVAQVPRALDVGFGGMKLVRALERDRERASPETPNVILIVMDTLRADRTSAYGYHRPTTPNLERLAARGLRYEDAVSASSWTWPSTASILTGLHPLEHGLQDEASCHLAESLVSLPEALQRRGWTTAAWSANLLIVPDKGFAQGFEHFEHAVGTTMPSHQLVPEALEWIAAQGDDRFFLYLQMLDPHSPLDPLPHARRELAPDVPLSFSKWAIEDYKWDLIGNCAFQPDPAAPDIARCVPAEHQRWISDLYDACIKSGDHWLGKLLDRLDELGRTDDTVVIFTSDHGEEMFEHGQLSHSQCLYQASVRVPLVLAGPGVPQGVVRERVANRHLAATIARICDTPWTTTPDALDLARPQAIEPRDVIVATRQGWWNGVYRQPLFALLRGEHVLHVAPEAGPFGAPREHRTGDRALFDLTRDPDERDDLAERRAALADALQADLERLAEELGARRTTRALGAGEGTLEMLKGIGYLGDE